MRTRYYSAAFRGEAQARKQIGRFGLPIAIAMTVLEAARTHPRMRIGIVRNEPLTVEVMLAGAPYGSPARAALLAAGFVHGGRRSSQWNWSDAPWFAPARDQALRDIDVARLVGVVETHALIT